jgi:NTP pyrophosphatase (non-canonical NTP hydrolase)
VNGQLQEQTKQKKDKPMQQFTISEMQEMQKALQEKYKHKWEPICPEIGQNKLLWMIGEIGEVIDIVKKNGGEVACSDAEIRKDLIEEMADVLMYFNDVMLCYGITEEELKKAYTEKFQRNMTRW